MTRANEAPGVPMLERSRPTGISIRAFVLALTVFCVLTALTAARTLHPIDRLATSLRFHLPLLAMDWFSTPFGVAGALGFTGLITAAIALSLWRSQRRLTVTILLAFLALNLIEAGLKTTLTHPNPPVLHHHHRSSGGIETALLRLLTSGQHPVLPPSLLLNSYPSGHMARSVFLGLLLCALVPTATLRTAAAVFFILMAAALILGGAHWPTDVGGGALLGWAAAAAAFASAGRRPADFAAPREDVYDAGALRAVGPHRHRDDQPA